MQAQFRASSAAQFGNCVSVAGKSRNTSTGLRSVAGVCSLPIETLWLHLRWSASASKFIFELKIDGFRASLFDINPPLTPQSMQLRGQHLNPLGLVP